MIKRECITCYQEYTVQGGKRAFLKSKFCSSKCRDISMKFSYEQKIDSLKNRLYKYSIRNENGCLIWKRSKNNKGYGRIGFGKQKSIFTHHAAWLIETKERAPKNKLLLHKCDMPSCIEINHIYLGTAAQNTADMMARKRHRPVKHNPDGYISSKLNGQKVIAIKEMLKNNIPLKDIAPKFGVSLSAIYDIRLGRTWHYKQEHKDE